MPVRIQKIIILLLFILSNYFLVAQEPIHVADLSFKMNSNSTQEYYYSFAKGDVIVVDFELTKGKNVQFEIVELPNQIKTSQFTARIFNYQVNVFSTKVYLFRITNSSGNKMCSLHIKRIPKSQETVNFNTGWQWKTLYDTTYTHFKEDSLVGHDTVHYTETVKEVASREITEEMLFDNTVEIKSIGWIEHDNPRAYVEVTLPQNKTEHYVKKRVIGWAFWLCVGDANSFWSRNKNALVKSASAIAGLSLSPLGAFVVGGVSDLVIPDQTKNNVFWAIIANNDNKNAFMRGDSYYSIVQNNGPGAYGKFLNETQGTYYICMYNENIHYRINVNVKASAVIETITYKDVDYERTKIVPKYVKVSKVRRHISSRQVRVPIE